MRIGVLTSSRADFGIYLPLLKALKSDVFFELKIIVFGTHLSSFHGETVNQIINEGFEVNFRIESLLLNDSAESISTAIGLTTIKFGNFWETHRSEFDLVFCLGDRYEMFAAVTAGIAFNIPFAHLHGGETTLGAIDNVFRHAITLASKYHFVSTEAYAQRVKEVTGSNENIYYVGALSLDNLKGLNLLTIEQFREKWNIDLSNKTVLVTFHPETIMAEENIHHTEQLVKVILEHPDFQYLITMPNADTSGNAIRKILENKLSALEYVYLIENLGSQSYFTAMKYCSFLLGNTSSGIIEAASFGKYVINLGDRQKGRASGGNVIHVPIDHLAIRNVINTLSIDTSFKGGNIYFKDNTAEQIIEKLKQIEYYAR
ncbi:UDP-N-acetyl-D-glucosamine 2-epimerase, UDP-hydrolysing [Pedobacter sp. PACM 27299]|uniref:UDP-N-acetylglucosamine 2-epimerase n=1 Tax=Pedobacter sp. PACM 27299 TaxID=1727164 RepID=UPI0007067C7D|nr:UDP-N-acetylglucosamine 2-epimerase [Pedobacter sp. PACM 27299]ALL04388.1 UDP-N-acetyl-D-glucosamine 2-epimerase, UDP-hydrolysing [Pedobacter sp. PACM 27299]